MGCKIEDVLEDLRKGKIVIVVDDEDRENEGDFVSSAQTITPEIITFMATQGKGLICMPITDERAKELDLDLMVSKNKTSDPFYTAFTVSVDKVGDGVTTGISSEDRYKTIKAIIDKNTKPEHLRRPGHMFPLIAKNGGVFTRRGHTEATVDLMYLAGLYPAGVIVEIINEDGTMARLPDLKILSEKFNIKIVSIEDIIEHVETKGIRLDDYYSKSN